MSEVPAIVKKTRWPLRQRRSVLAVAVFATAAPLLTGGAAGAYPTPGTSANDVPAEFLPAPNETAYCDSVDYFGPIDQLVDLVAADNQLDVDPTLCLLYTSPSPRDKRQSRMPSSA